MSKYYNIQVVNNQTGEIIKNEKINGLKIISYNEVLKKYSNLKYDYKDTDTTISVLRFENDNVKTMYQKVFHSMENQMDKRETIYDICTELDNNINKFLDKFEDVKLLSRQLQSAYDKKNDLIQHYFDNLSGLADKSKDQLDERQKDNILNISMDILKARVQRRNVKNEKQLIDDLVKNDLIHQLKLIKDKIKIEKKMTIYKNNKTAEKWVNKEVNLENKYIEVPYHNFKERVRIIAKLEKKYDKVTYNGKDKKILAYNKNMKYNDKLVKNYI